VTGPVGLLRRFGPAAFGLALLVGAIYAVQKEFRGLAVADIGTAMAAIPPDALRLGGALTVLAYLVLAIYDRLGSIYAGHPVSWLRSLFASFCGYSLAHNLGFAAVSGAAVRYRLYSAWGLTAVQIAKVIGFTSLTYGLGGMALAGVVLMIEPEVVPWFGAHVPRWMLQALALPLWGVVLSYIILSRFRRHIRVFGHEIDLPSPRMALMQTVLATIDVAITAAIFYVLLPVAPGLTFLRFLGIYLAAYTAGIAAHVPGGLGVFDGAILLGLEPYLAAPQVIGALLIFRLYYYIIPLFIAGTLFVLFELGQRKAVFGQLGGFGRGSETLQVPAIASLAALGGALLIFLGALPTSDTIIERWAGRSAALASHFAASIVGSLLLVTAWGLLRRLTLAWGMAVLLLLTGASIAWMRGEPWWLVLAFLLLAGLVAAVRGNFYRDTRISREPLSAEVLLPVAAIVGCGITLALVAHGGRVSTEAWWQVVRSPLAPDSLRFTVGLTALLLLAGLIQLLRPVFREAPWDGATRQRLGQLGALMPPVAEAAVFGEAGKAGFSFAKQPGIWVALGDPAGEPKDAISAIWRFRDLCERAGVEAAFWGIGTRYQRFYADIGLQSVLLEDQGASPGLRLAIRAERDPATLRALL
jgi:phosphatidylglycerol lysyltransferase